MRRPFDLETVFATLLVCTLTVTRCKAFSTLPIGHRVGIWPSSSSIVSLTMPNGKALWYRNHSDDNDDDESTQQERGRQQQKPSIPVLGPFVGQPPLLLGASRTLSPTPLQWQAVEESLQKAQEETEDSTAAPLIAIMDSSDQFATLAAVVGLSRKPVEGSKKSSGDDLLTPYSDNASFMESLQGQSSASSETELCLRLVGVGRATLSDLFYQVPSDSQEMDEEGHLVIEMEDGDDEENDDDVEEEEEDSSALQSRGATPIVMSYFTVVADSSAGKSPMHAVTTMSKLTQKVEWMHQDRRRWVSVRQAAEARLAQAQQNAEEDDLLVDHDGLGALFDWSEKDDEVEMETLVLEKTESKQQKKSPNEDTTNDSGDNKDNKFSEDGDLLSQLENYGLGASASTFSRLADLAKVDMELLTPFYSPAKRESEEFYFEVLSFAAMRALHDTVEAKDLTWSLRCTDTTERLERAYDWMWSHVRLLKEEAERVRDELRLCGDDCTDLF